MRIMETGNKGFIGMALSELDDLGLGGKRPWIPDCSPPPVPRVLGKVDIGSSCGGECLHKKIAKKCEVGGDEERKIRRIVLVRFKLEEKQERDEGIMN